MKKQDLLKIVKFDNSNYIDAGLYTLHQIFMAEKGNNFGFIGFTLASVEDWLKGLPSCLDFPFYDHDIYNLGFKDIGTYWRKLAACVYDLVAASESELVGIVSNIERLDTSYHGNPRYSFLLNTGHDVIRLQTEIDGSLGYDIKNHNHKKVIVKTKWIRNKLCAIWVQGV